MYMSALIAIAAQLPGPASSANETKAIGSWSWAPDTVALGAIKPAWIPLVLTVALAASGVSPTG
jgi:hypothetical protein